MATAKKPEEVVCLNDLHIMERFDELRVPIPAPLGLTPQPPEQYKLDGFVGFDESTPSASSVSHGGSSMGDAAEIVEEWDDDQIHNEHYDLPDDEDNIDFALARKKLVDMALEAEHRHVTKCMVYYPARRQANWYFEICHSFMHSALEDNPNNIWIELPGIPRYGNKLTCEAIETYRKDGDVSALMRCRDPYWMAYSRWYSFIMADQMFGQVFAENATVADLYRQGIMIDTEQPDWLVMTVIVMLRAVREYPEKIVFWDGLVRAGMSPRLALVWACCMKSIEAKHWIEPEYHGHQMFDMTCMSINDCMAIVQGKMPEGGKPMFMGYNGFNSYWLGRPKDSGEWGEGDGEMRKLCRELPVPEEKVEYTNPFTDRVTTTTRYGHPDPTHLVDAVVDLSKRKEMW